MEIRIKTEQEFRDQHVTFEIKAGPDEAVEVVRRLMPGAGPRERFETETPADRLEQEAVVLRAKAAQAARLHERILQLVDQQSSLRDELEGLRTSLSARSQELRTCQQELSDARSEAVALRQRTNNVEVEKRSLLDRVKQADQLATDRLALIRGLETDVLKSRTQLARIARVLDDERLSIVETMRTVREIVDGWEA